MKKLQEKYGTNIHQYVKANNKYMKGYDYDKQFMWLGNVAKGSSK